MDRTKDDNYGICVEDSELWIAPKSIKSTRRLTIGDLILVNSKMLGGCSKVLLYDFTDESWYSETYFCNNSAYLNVSTNSWPFLLSIENPCRRYKFYCNTSLFKYVSELHVNDVVFVSNILFSPGSQLSPIECYIKYVGPIKKLGPGTYFFFKIVNGFSPQHEYLKTLEGRGIKEIATLDPARDLIVSPDYILKDQFISKKKSTSYFAKLQQESENASSKIRIQRDTNRNVDIPIEVANNFLGDFKLSEKKCSDPKKNLLDLKKAQQQQQHEENIENVDQLDLAAILSGVWPKEAEIMSRTAYNGNQNGHYKIRYNAPNPFSHFMQNSQKSSVSTQGDFKLSEKKCSDPKKNLLDLKKAQQQQQHEENIENVDQLDLAAILSGVWPKEAEIMSRTAYNGNQNGHYKIRYNAPNPFSHFMQNSQKSSVSTQYDSTYNDHNGGRVSRYKDIKHDYNRKNIHQDKYPPLYSQKFEHKKQQLPETSPPPPNQITPKELPSVPNTDLDIGTMVEVNILKDENLPGVIRWIGKFGGKTPFILIGVELTEKVLTKFDASQNLKYFECAANRAVYVRPDQCQKDKRFTKMHHPVQ